MKTWRKMIINENGLEKEISLVSISFNEYVDYGMVLEKGKRLGLEMCPSVLKEMLIEENAEQFEIDQKEGDKRWAAHCRGEELPAEKSEREFYNLVFKNISEYEHMRTNGFRMQYIGGGIEFLNLCYDGDAWPEGANFVFMKPPSKK
jgi:hypothetical protein